MLSFYPASHTVTFMTKFIRMTNLFLMTLLGLVLLLTIMGVFSQDMARLLPSWPELLILETTYLLPWYSLRHKEKTRLLRFARGFAAVVLTLSVVGPAGVVLSGGVISNPVTLVLFVLTGLPALLNFLELHRLLGYKVRYHPLTYIVAHWRGQLSLGQSFWINGVGMGNLLLAALVTGLSRLLEASDVSLRILAGISLAGFFCATLVWLWAVTGIIRSASKHKTRGGSGWTAALTMLMAFFSVLGMLMNTLSSYIPQMKEYALLASGHDSMKPVEISSMPNGHVLILRGTLGEGSMERFAATVGKTPGLKTVSLNSPGGRLREAKQMAALLKSRQLNTYVEGECSSACTYVFLAGKDRAATPNAHIGFHQPSFAGMGSTELAIASSGMEKYYRAANLPGDFIHRVLQIKPEGMWYPNREELLKANVINRVSLGNEGNTMFDLESREEVLADLNRSNIWRQYERRSPGKINEVADLIWNMKQQGKEQPEIQDAVKMLTREIHLRAQKAAPDNLLDEHAQLLTDMLEAARQISPQACSQLIKGTLSVQRTIPEELVRRDAALLEKMLASSPRDVSYNMGSKEFARSAGKLQERLNPLQRKITADLAAYDNQPMFQCDAVIGMYHQILRMQDTDRHIILSALMQAK